MMLTEPALNIALLNSKTDEARTLHSAARDFGVKRSAKLLELGRVLIDIKAILPHGSFEGYVSDTLGIDPRNARNWMANARNPDGRRASKTVKVTVLEEAPKSTCDTRDTNSGTPGAALGTTEDDRLRRLAEIEARGRADQAMYMEEWDEYGADDEYGASGGGSHELPFCVEPGVFSPGSGESPAAGSKVDCTGIRVFSGASQGDHEADLAHSSPPPPVCDEAHTAAVHRLEPKPRSRGGAGSGTQMLLEEVYRVAASVRRVAEMIEQREVSDEITRAMMALAERAIREAGGNRNEKHDGGGA